MGGGKRAFAKANPQTSTSGLSPGTPQRTQTSRGRSQDRSLATGQPSEAEMFHPPKMPQRQRNGNGTGFQRVPVDNPLNADVAPVADPFF